MNALSAVRRCFLVAAVFAAAFPRAARAVEGYPGSVWGNATTDNGGPSGVGSMGWVRQGVHWVTLPGGVKFETFASYNYRLRSERRPFYNTDGPSAGVELRRDPFTLGADYYYEKFRELGRNSNNREVYLGWYVPGRSRARFPWSTWGKLVHDTTGLTGSSAMGWVRQSVQSDPLPGGVSARAFAEYSYRGRTKARKFYDSRGPALGLELAASPFTLGVSHTWETLPFHDGDIESTEVYLTWYYSWDLKRRK